MRSMRIARAALPLVAAGLFLSGPGAGQAADSVQITFFDVGQGDAAIIRSPEGKVALIDAGPDADIVTLLERHGVDTIAIAIASHAHADHIGGMEAVLRAFPVGYYLDNGLPHTTATYRNLMRALAATAGLWWERVMPVADYVARALFETPKGGKAIVPGIPMPKVSLRRKRRTRTGVVRGFDPLPEPSWGAFVAPAPSWAGMSAFQRVKAADRAWGPRETADPTYFRTEILPKLEGLPLRQLEVVTGMSTSTCSLIRRGRQVPHPRHWQPLLELTTRAGRGAASEPATALRQ